MTVCYLVLTMFPDLLERTSVVGRFTLYCFNIVSVSVSL